MPRFALLLALLLALPTVAHAEVRRRTADGFVYDVEDQAGGQIGQGSETSGRFAYADAYHLAVSVAGAVPRCYDTANRAARTLSGGELLHETYTVPGSQVRVNRRVWVPSAGGEFVRYLDTFRNDGVTTVRIAASIVGDLGVNNAEVFLTADRSLNDPAQTNRQRDEAPETDDVWVGQDDDDAQGISTLVHVIQGYEAGLAPGTVAPDCMAIPYSQSSDRCDGAIADPCGAGAGMSGFRWDFEFDVPPGETRALLTFGLQGPNRESTVAEADRIVNLPDDVILNISEELLESIVNFQVTGVPRVVLEAPVAVDEGQPIVVRAVVDDPADQAVEWSWDLPLADNQGDGDGVFGEAPNATMVTVPGEITNGPLDHKIRVRAVRSGDPSSVRTATAVVQVRNVPPVIRSSPPTGRLYVGDTYEYDVVVDDAPGESSFIGYLLTVRPTGMTRDAEGRIRWEVKPEHRGRTHQVVLEVSDDGGGRATQSWELTVENNLRPLPPTPLDPIDLVMLSDRMVTLTAQNGSDPEGDVAQIFFRVTKDVTDFATAEWPVLDDGMYASGARAEDASGTTSWQIPMVLDHGTYFWEVYSVDALGAKSESRYASFYVRNPAPPDGGSRPPTMRGDDDGGCAVRPASGAAPLLPLAAVVGVLVLRRRRRR